MTTIASECLPPEIVDPDVGFQTAGHQVFQPFPDPCAPSFEDVMRLQVGDIVRSRQMHSERHTPTCFKYSTKECRLRFPRELVEITNVDLDTGVIRM